jgi:hypothetical protein
MLVRADAATKQNIELSSGARRYCFIKIMSVHMCLHLPAGLCTVCLFGAFWHYILLGQNVPDAGVNKKTHVQTKHKEAAKKEVQLTGQIGKK